MCVCACGPLRRDVEAGEGTPSYCWSAGTARRELVPAAALKARALVPPVSGEPDEV